MHFEILVEDQSGAKALSIIIPKIIDNAYTFNIHHYKGCGHIPRNLKTAVNARSKKLLNSLPKLFRGYGKTYPDYSNSYRVVVIVVCDLDNKCLKTFRQELFAVLNACNPKPETRFCIAIEEGEAWLLGDMPAIKIAYPSARNEILEGYENDSICGTWELLADAVFAGGSAELRERGWQAVGREKSMWAEEITPHMNVDANASPSFCYFRDKMRALAGMA